MELFFNREAEKSRIVRDHRVVLIDIHRYLAWILHVRAESPKRGGSIREDELHELLRKYLASQGHKPELSEELFTGMVERVVAIVSRVQGTYEFEVQPLREYFAARYLYESAPYSPPGRETKGTLLDRFDALAKNFYWLNVTRFYAGCYSAGELPSLITGIDALIESDDFKNTSHPRVLASMLLADWVFTQHPRSVRQVVKLILDGPGMRVILANNNRRAAQAAALILPNGGGREEVLDRAFELLRSAPAAEFAFNLVKLIVQNRGAADVRDRWSREVLKRKGDRRTIWIEFGIRLGYFSAMADSELEKIFSDTDFNVDRVRQLLRAHRLDWLESKETRLVAAIECIAANRFTSDPNTAAKHVLEAFVKVIDINTYSLLMHMILNERYFSHASEHGERAFKVEQSANPSALVSETLAFCSKICSLAREQFSKPPSEWTNSLVPWTTIVENIRSRLGDQPALFGIAAISAGIKSEDLCMEASSLFDESVELCRRARFARQKAGMLGWWSAQLGAAKTENQLYLAITLAAIWTGRATFQHLIPILDKRCQELDMRIWTEIANTISSIVSCNLSTASKKHISVDEIPSNAGERILMLASLRLPDDQRCVIFRDRLIGYRGNDKIVLRFCQDQAYESLLFGTGERRGELEMIGHCYENDIFLTSRAFRRYPSQRRKNLSRNFVETIISNTDKYPAELVTLAEDSHQAELGKRVQSVGAVARSEAWFVEARR